MKPQRLRILNVHNVPAHYRAGLFRQLQERHEQEVVFFQGPKVWREARNLVLVHGFRAETLEGPLLWRWLQLAQRIFFGRYDLLLMTFDGKLEPLMALLAAKLRRKPCVLWHGLWDVPRRGLWRLVQPFLGPFFQSWDAILTYGPHTQRTLVAQGVPPSKVFLAPQTVDNTIFARPVSAALRAQTREAWGLQRANACLFVGRLVEDKGLRILAEAVARTRGRWRLITVGEGPLKGLPGMHLGHRAPEDLALIYASADCLVLPSITTESFREPWGLVINEAMNQGLPVIATNAVGAAAGGLAEHERSALVVPEKDPAALADALMRFDRDPELARRLGQEGKRRIAHLTYADMADHFEAAFDHACHAVV